MDKYDTIYSHTFTIPNYALDKHEKTNLTYLIQLMQETGSYHSIAYKLTVSDLLKEHKTWMLTKQRIDIAQYLSWPDTIRIDTWIEKPTRFVVPRFFKAYDKAENLVFTAATYWCIIDLIEHRPLPISSITDFSWVDSAPMHIAPIKKLKLPEDTDLETFTYQPIVLYRDSDLNKHVNNIVYSEWCLESMSSTFRDRRQPAGIEIHYLKETYTDDLITVSSRYDTSTGTCWHTISAVREDEEYMVCIAKSLWEDR